MRSNAVSKVFWLAAVAILLLAVGYGLLAQQQVVQCTDPPGGTITCESEQLATCTVAKGKVQGRCQTPPSNLAQKGELDAWILSAVTSRPVSPAEARKGEFQDILKSGHWQKDDKVVTFKSSVEGAGWLTAAAFMGTWKVNEAKSKLSAGTPKNTTVVYEAGVDSVKVTIDGTDADGKPIHDEWTGKFDGKDYPVTGDPSSDTRSVKKIDDHTLEFAVKKDGKVTTSGRIVLSADGKTRTVTVSGTDAKGNRVSSTAVYDKQ